ncbi:MAG: hypothetical protein ACRC2T_20495 [Thermoguttaceae bacterium]
MRKDSINMSEREQCVKLLQKWIEDNCLIPKSVNGFWQTFANWKEEEVEEYKSIFGNRNDSAVTLQDASINLMLRTWTSGDYVRLIVSYDIYIYNKVVGYYKAVFTLDGEWDDDVLFFSS